MKLTGWGFAPTREMMRPTVKRLLVTVGLKKNAYKRMSNTSVVMEKTSGRRGLRYPCLGICCERKLSPPRGNFPTPTLQLQGYERMGAVH